MHVEYQTLMPSLIRIVLVDTSHPGNIGAAARAMKNMALSELTLVRPREFPSSEAAARASGADDILQRARVAQTLEEAVADCAIVAGATSRPRMHYWKVFDARAAAREIVKLEPQPVAVVFGSERYGLSNEELNRCNWLIRIPANPEYESLNLSQAVQIIAYELFLARGATNAVPLEREAPLATAQEMHRLYEHLEQVLLEVDFRDRTPSSGHLMGRLRRLLNRAELDQNEMNILRGVLSAVQNKRRTAGDK